MLRDLFRFGGQVIRFVTVDLGSKQVSVPVADLRGCEPGKTLLVTAGMDGDEYAGIEAAYRLIEEYSRVDFKGRLVIIPIVNIPGFEQECSQNPLDGYFPKMIFPGNPNGSSTERLVHWLVTTYAFHTDMWQDLHGGAMTERIHPFLWTFQTGVASSEAIIKLLQDAFIGETVVTETKGRSSKASCLARLGCTYVMAESGDRVRRSEDVDRHISWVKHSMALLGMIAPLPSLLSPPTIYRNISYLTAPFDGLWRLIPGFGNPQVGDIIGAYARRDGLRWTELHMKIAGQSLWWKETLCMRKGDVLCAVGY